ncbi:MAG: indolepyruvate oxidoreductase subunit beta family protein [Rubrivivax sp.]|jgi:indolepyruvate ferredoxin oxidoreductase beta subunit|nr:indolepyruvate oxidoreductase subunit beta family protein [Rubrivivax sp.]
MSARTRLGAPDRPLTLLICALGGEGGGVLTQWLVDAARLAGHRAQATSIPGVAQRTGSTTYYLEFDPQRESERSGAPLVFNLSPVPGALDALVSSELLETARQAGNGMLSAERTLVLSSSARTLTTLERMAPGDGRLDDAALRRLVAAFSREHQVLDMAGLARQHGTVVSAVMLGAIAGSGLLPFERRHFEDAVKAGGGSSASTQASLKGFAAACDEVASARTRGAFVAQVLGGSELKHAAQPSTPTGAITATPAPGAKGSMNVATIASGQNGETGVSADGARGPGAAAQRLLAGDARFPDALHPLLTLGCERLIAYQGAGYARLYLDRVAAVLQTEQAKAAVAAPTPGQPAEEGPITREVARGLAVWMAFDDVIRVAELKSRAARLERVRGEARAGAQDVLKVFDHFKPGVPEFAALLPAGLARRLQAWDARRQARGDKPWALPLKIGTHTITGVLALRALGLLKPLRPLGSRWAAEQALIEQWLGAVRDGTRQQAELGLELARCCRLVKGYGGTHDRGREQLLHVLQHLATANGTPAQTEAAAQAVAAAREAALADGSGKALAEALRHHGAPPQAVREQPIRWVRKSKPGNSAAPHRGGVSP